jgi:hypothetical protein
MVFLPGGASLPNGPCDAVLLVFSLPSGCRSHPLGVLLAIRARKFRRTGNTECRKAPSPRRKRSSAGLRPVLSGSARHALRAIHYFAPGKIE